MKIYNRSFHHSFCAPFIIIVISFLVTLINCIPILYKGDEPGLTLLGSSNFSETIFHQNSVFIVEFYNSWCGHCVRFAPTWKLFARDIQHWSPVVKVVAVDCAEDINVKLCSDYNIALFPSIRYFWHNYDIKTSGQPHIGNIGDVSAIRHDFLDWMHVSWSQKTPKTWPNLSYWDPLNLHELQDVVSMAKQKDVYVIVEGEKSYLGREVILDLALHQDKFIIRRIKTGHQWLNQLNESPLLLPVIIKISSEDGKPIIIKRATELGKDHRIAIVNSIKLKYNINVQNSDAFNSSPKTHSSPKSQLGAPRIKPTDDLYLSDLYLSIHETLYKQIPLHKSLDSDRLNILKNFITILLDYFPFDQDSPKNFLSMLSKWLSTKIHGIEMNEFVSVLETFNREFTFPKPEEWVTCRGSEPVFRGYPCSLWLLFHTLTVNEYVATDESPKSHKVLHTMRDYITNFFSCAECAKHFEEMSNDLDQSLLYPNSSVLWLWKAHNIVNKRLFKDITEDPAHPKVQYPSPSSCVTCWLTNEKKFNETATFLFLINRYKKDSLIHTSRSSENHIAITVDQYEPSENKISIKPVHLYEHDFNHSGNLWTWPNVILNRMDMSLCLFLYVLTSCMLLTFCFILSIKKRRRKDHKLRYPMAP